MHNIIRDIGRHSKSFRRFRREVLLLQKFKLDESYLNLGASHCHCYFLNIIIEAALSCIGRHSKSFCSFRREVLLLQKFKLDELSYVGC